MNLPPVQSPPGEIVNHFVRGFVATGLLAAAATPAAAGRARDRVLNRTVLRRALQGGTAMAAGVAAANALQQRRYGTAALSLALGAAGLLAIEHLIKTAAQPAATEGDHGQETEA